MDYNYVSDLNYKILFEPKILFPCFTGTIIMFSVSQLEPIIAPRLIELGATRMQIGIIFSL
jgi:hypothetical protein